ncbi:MAG: transcriptional regulator PerR [bacterium]|nr:MAG: transcriptional regulator PerR [bacterium]
MMKTIDHKKAAMDILRAKALKVTPQRIALINEISNAGHISTDQIYKKMKNEFPSISAATIYKIIDIFLDKHILKEIRITAGKKRYELKKEPHAHYVCTICGQISDLYLSSEDLLRQIRSKGYRPAGCEIYFYGSCPNCCDK